MDKINWQKFWLTIGIGFGIVFLSAFITSQIVFPILFGRPKNVEVPDLVGQSFSKARRSLVDLGLHAVVRDSIWSEKDIIDTILEQDPEPGKKLKPEGTVYLRVSRGSKQVGVPSIIGLSYQEAYYALHSAGLKAAVSDSLYSDSYAINTVIRSDPAVGSDIEKGSRVRLTMSRGRQVKAEVADSSGYDDPNNEY